MNCIKYKNGNLVKVGAFVRVIYIDESIIKTLAVEENEDVKSMQNEVLEVYEINEYGQAWVEKYWDLGNGKTESHSLGLCSHELELASKCS
ncbi:hypothetical protein [Candidatus Endoriftia persephonae]|jgi:hypothetical protein|uniref:Uncharacterized protein n=1 Tax=Candidatus Endoriftia persephonae TaxID=393765 RepID=A0A9J6ZUL8_9GAMM|nr:hypothetical protein [Candidatus Endoriftia persephone]USF86410.1 hypothetical protein L0Y14_09655 [Candidatus Endoriftia persephone]